jgi:hypothetical protein
MERSCEIMALRTLRGVWLPSRDASREQHVHAWNQISFLIKP